MRPKQGRQGNLRPFCRFSPSESRMIEPESISVGDVVRLSCGSPKMTVEALRIDDSGEEVADVMLYVEGVGIDHDTVPLKHLVWPRNKEDAA